MAAIDIQSEGPSARTVSAVLDEAAERIGAAGVERFLIEFLRRNDPDTLGLTTAQLESLTMVLGGAIWIAIVVRRHGGIGLPAANESARAPA